MGWREGEKIPLDIFSIISYILVDGSTFATKTLDASGPTTPAEVVSPAYLSGILDLFQQAVPEQFFQQLEKQLGRPSRRRIFTLPLVIWLMIGHRVEPNTTLSS